MIGSLNFPLMPQRMDQDKVHNRQGILQTVRMMPHPRFGNNRDRAAELLVPLFQNTGILLHRHYFIRLPADMQQRNPRPRQGRQIIDGIVPVCHRLLFRQAIRLQTLLPVLRAAGTFPLPARPAFKIADRGIRINTGHLIRIGGSPVIHNQPAPAHAFQGGLGCKTMFFNQKPVKVIPAFYCRGRTEKPRHVRIHQMKSPLQQGDIRLRLAAVTVGVTTQQA
ncbi:MAG: hypothetical protein BWY71_01948 [Planctomycetes bacterium ADurb.Bin412]|nr:MAG: hypothetical protein BWY71_01948 [Planctomycetes bacterium ADurb.Bin412]